jgi:hypothetical protein
MIGFITGLITFAFGLIILIVDSSNNYQNDYLLHVVFTCATLFLWGISAICFALGGIEEKIKPFK